MKCDRRNSTTGVGIVRCRKSLHREGSTGQAPPFLGSQLGGRPRRLPEGADSEAQDCEGRGGDGASGAALDPLQIVAFLTASRDHHVDDVTGLHLEGHVRYVDGDRARWSGALSRSIHGGDDRIGEGDAQIADGVDRARRAVLHDAAPRERVFDEAGGLACRGRALRAWRTGCGQQEDERGSTSACNRSSARGGRVHLRTDRDRRQPPRSPIRRSSGSKRGSARRGSRAGSVIIPNSSVGRPR